MFQGLPSVMISGTGIQRTGATGGGSSLLDGLQVYYKLEDLTDSSGNGLTLTNTANAATFDPGKIGNGVTIFATSQFLSHLTATQFEMGTATDFTLCYWVNSTQSTTRAPIFYGTTNALSRWYSTMTATQIFVGIGDDAAHASSAVKTGTYNDGTWHFVLGTVIRGGNIQVYVDNSAGNLTNSAAVTGTLTNASGSFSIGRNVTGLFQGMVDEFGLWNRILTPAEISTLWNGGTGITYPFS